MAGTKSAMHGPSPTVPLFLVSTMVGMAFLSWLKSYIAAVVVALQEIIGKVFLWPLLIILGMTLGSTVCKWMDGPGGSSPPEKSVGRNRDWKAASSSVEQQQQGGDGAGVGLFMFLVFALVLIPWR